MLAGRFAREFRHDNCTDLSRFAASVPPFSHIEKQPQPMPVSDDDLKFSERLIEEVQHRIAQQRDCIERLRANVTDKAHTQQMLEAFETNLRLFEENRQLLIENHKACMRRTLATREEELAQLKKHRRTRELGESL